MFADRRRGQIVRLVRQRGEVSVSELASLLAVSSMTIRRDLDHLEEEHALRRVHGGAVPFRGSGPRIGLMVPHLDDYFAEVVSGAERASDRLGASLVLATHFYDQELEHDRLARLLALSLDALVLATTGRADDTLVAPQALSQLAVPTVLVERQFRWGEHPAGSVRTDHARGAELALDHLYQRGATPIACLFAQSPTTPALLAAVDPARPGANPRVAFVRVVKDWPGRAAIADQFVAECLAITADEPVRGLYVHSDPLADEVVGALRRRGLRVPDDIAVVSHDDLTASSGQVPLTAVRPPRHHLGEQAVALACELVAQPRQPVRHVVIEPTLVVRASS